MKFSGICARYWDSWQRLHDSRYETWEEETSWRSATAQGKSINDSIDKSINQSINQLINIFQHESLVAGISEKDSHIAMLEMQNESADKIGHARRQREKMMRKLKEENERRVRLLNDVKNDMVTDLTAPMSRSMMGGAHDQVRYLRYCRSFEKGVR